MQTKLPIETKDGAFNGFNSFPLEYQPEMLTIKKDLIYKLLSALEFGLESAQQVLCEHDTSLGRDWTKNRIWAETLEKEIQDMKDCIKELKSL